MGQVAHHPFHSAALFLIKKGRTEIQARYAPLADANLAQLQRDLRRLRWPRHRPASPP